MDLILYLEDRPASKSEEETAQGITGMFEYVEQFMQGHALGYREDICAEDKREPCPDMSSLWNPSISEQQNQNEDRGEAKEEVYKFAFLKHSILPPILVIITKFDNEKVRIFSRGNIVI